MRVKMKVGISGNRGDGTDWPDRGGEIDVPDIEGKDLCDAGMAIEVKESKAEKKAEPKVETATKDEDSEKAGGLTTESGPVKRGPGRPRKDA